MKSLSPSHQLAYVTSKKHTATEEIVVVIVVIAQLSLQLWVPIVGIQDCKHNYRHPNYKYNYRQKIRSFK
jgi:hypothetical protein